MIKLENSSPDNFDLNILLLPARRVPVDESAVLTDLTPHPNHSRPGPVSPRLLCLMQRLYNINNNIIIIYIVQAGVFAGVKYSTTAGRRGFIGAAAFICGVRLPGRPKHWGCKLGTEGTEQSLFFLRLQYNSSSPHPVPQRVKNSFCTIFRTVWITPAPGVARCARRAPHPRSHARSVATLDTMGRNEKPARVGCRNPTVLYCTRVGRPNPG